MTNSLRCLRQLHSQLPLRLRCTHTSTSLTANATRRRYQSTATQQPTNNAAPFPASSSSSASSSGINVEFESGQLPATGFSSNNSSYNSSNASAGSTHFGRETIPTDQKVQRVGEVFTRVAQRYDVMNDAMSFGIHRLWKDSFISMLQPTPDMKLLDVGGGTGDIAFRFLDAAKAASALPALSSPAGTSVNSAQVVVSDINPDMLAVGEQRARQLGYNTSHTPDGKDPQISFRVADAEQLPFDDNSFDAYTIAFCLRNVTNPQNAINEAYRVLRPGGRFMCLEFSHVTNPVLKQIYDMYSFNVIPLLGQSIAGDRASYDYLVESIRNFPDQETMSEMTKAAGFRAVSYTNMTFGVVAVHSGFKL